MVRRKININQFTDFKSLDKLKTKLENAGYILINEDGDGLTYEKE